MTDRFARQISLFGLEGQRRLTTTRVVVAGVGGLGTHVVQQLALLGVGAIVPVDSEELDHTNRNRYVGARHTDPIPGSHKVLLGHRLVAEIDPAIRVEPIHDSIVSAEGFAAIRTSDYVFGCVDSEGARFVLNEVCSAYARPYIDLASDVIPPDRPDDRLAYGGRVCVNVDGGGCLVCLGLVDLDDANAELGGPDRVRNEEVIYGVPREVLKRSGPSVVSINGVVASLGVTEFMVAVTGLRQPRRVLNYLAHMGRLTESTDPPEADCYYCKGIRGRPETADVERYIRAEVGRFLR
jgi:hypothetical protein